MTTYATTYGWRSTRIREDLMTSPPEQNPMNGGRRGPTRVHRTADPITTNQKVAGSSPAERAPISPANGLFLLARFRLGPPLLHKYAGVLQVVCLTAPSVGQSADLPPS